MTAIEELKFICREDDVPFFSEAELQHYLVQNNGSVRDAAYRALLVKAEDSTLSVSGYNGSDTSKYFRRLANQYRPSNSGILSGMY